MQECIQEVEVTNLRKNLYDSQVTPRAQEEVKVQSQLTLNATQKSERKQNFKVKIDYVISSGEESIESSSIASESS